ncbi:MAG: hypothetical protein FJ406_12685 [Verrucomicrobia bacterium]|nr:hypothetical protein [Verrucomicrobiota bacterium]MBM3871935.1 hypothetical protein [Verrucomicrobiota bacterium]
MKTKPAHLNQFTAAVLAVVMTAMGWFLRSETAHDFLHVHATAAQLARSSAAQLAREGKAVVTQTPRWLKVVAAPAETPVPAPAGPHQHRSFAFDSLASGGWSGLFAPVEVPVPNLTAVTVAPSFLSAEPHGSAWLLAPGRAPPIRS